MQTVTCRKCARPLCKTDGEKVCFSFGDYEACVWIRGQYERVECRNVVNGKQCGNVAKIKSLDK